MKSVPDNSPVESSSSIPIVQSIPTSVRVWLWICLTAWAISIFLPAVKLGGGGRSALGWEIVYDALILLVVPVADQADGEGGRARLCHALLRRNSLSNSSRISSAVSRSTRSGDATAGRFLRLGILDDCGRDAGHADCVGRKLGLYPGHSFEHASPVFTNLPPGMELYSGAGRACLKQSVTEFARCRYGEDPTHHDQARIVTKSLKGEPVTFSTRVSVLRGSTPSGTVSITDGKETIYSVHTDGDVARVAANLLSIGEHSMQARFVADTSELYVGDTANLVQVVNDPKDRETRAVLSLTEQHPGRARTIGFSLRAKVTAEKTRTVAAPGSVILTSSGGGKIFLQLDQNGEATLSSSIAEDRWKGYHLQAFYMGGKGFQASASQLILK